MALTEKPNHLYGGFVAYLGGDVSGEGEGQGAARRSFLLAERAGACLSGWMVYLVYLVLLVRFSIPANQTNETDKIDQMNQASFDARS